ncbi:MAG: MFS transporter [Bacteroidia bacterium]|nr:MFS transporter [Bacteroidia bacterium]
MTTTLKKSIPHFRWWIAGLLALATALNYLDRQSLPVAISEIQKSITISEVAYSRLQMLFLISYSLMYLVGGKLIDIMGSRLGYLVMILWWSIANFIHGLMSTVMGLGVARFLLGMGEGGGFPASAKVVSEWFPAKERSLAFGIFNTGSSLGSVIAPPMIAFIILELDWRWVFFLTGSLGFIWAFFWFRMYQKPENSTRVSEEEKAYIKAGQIQEETEGPKVKWVDLFKFKKTWGLVLAKFLSDAAWYFYIFWLPKYLADARGLDIKEIGYYAWIPFAFAGAGSFLAGWLSTYLIKKNISLDRSRKICLAIAACLMPIALFITGVPLSMAIVFFSMAMFGHQAFSTLMQTLTADMYPSHSVGSIAGLVGAAGSMGGVVFSFFVGLLLSNFGYGPVFIIAGILHPISFLLILFLVQKVEMIHIRSAKSGSE